MGGCYQGSDCPCSWPGFTAKKHQHRAVMQEIPDYKRQAPPRGRKERSPYPSPAPPTWAVRPHAGRSGTQTLGTLATTEHARESQAYNTVTLHFKGRALGGLSSLLPGAAPARSIPTTTLASRTTHTLLHERFAPRMAPAADSVRTLPHALFDPNPLSLGWF